MSFRFIFSQLCLWGFLLSWLHSKVLFAESSQRAAVILGVQPYTLQDLKILSQEKQFEEFFNHFHDLSPKERSAEWVQLTQSAVTDWLKTLQTKKYLSFKDYSWLQKLAQDATVQKTFLFTQRRRELSLRWLKNCFQEQGSSHPECWTHLIHFLYDPPVDMDAIPALWAMIEEWQTDEALKLPLMQKLRPLDVWSALLQTELASDHCRKASVQELLWNELLKTDQIPDLLTLAHRDCWPSLSSKALLKFKKGAQLKELKIAQAILKLTGSWSKNLEEIYYFQAYFETHGPSDELNLSWNFLKALEKSPQKRVALLQALKEWDHYPDQLFIHSSVNVKKTFSAHLKNSFPEYIDHYAQTCLAFYAQARPFPSGNPAQNCTNFFSINEHVKQFTAPGLYETYKKAVE
jgi:hypothetical protein